jgi:hypothetical protein
MLLLAKRGMRKKLTRALGDSGSCGTLNPNTQLSHAGVILNGATRSAVASDFFLSIEIPTHDGLRIGGAKLSVKSSSVN